MLLTRLGKTQAQVIEDTKIPKNRMSEIANDKVVPKPDEIVLIDKALEQNRRLVLTYCSRTCPAGQYAGYQFNDMDIPTAGMKFVSIMAGMVRALPRIANMLSTGRLTPSVLAKLRQLRLIIMAIEVQAAPETVVASYNVVDLEKAAEKRKNRRKSG